MDLPKTQHKYDFEQFVEVLKEGYPPVVQIVAKVIGPCCAEHSVPYYGCVAGNDHFTLCEAILKPVPPKENRSLN